ncbi:uncharacterized LabA/DUF88 family protein [Silvimonas terrae]|uniref:Uncharacterized LabA/DUF88 family protein n=1 Tax=Silvimonas terrae TaxID=300266 RepID=A0A840REE9_9NEIS|nr:NYN domain-containing protein [Silvimonas terrae]MBB5190682.1 uncharacterized LabA/DUF88 family protein [Silvimonas terrae]
MTYPATAPTLKLAVLIDADNAQASIVQELLAEIAKYGTTNVKRAYGDWTTTNLKGWKEVLHTQAIQPIQQFAYTSGKNATDSALIIDAMDLLHMGDMGGFCIVSSDSDYTRLATRLRESGLTVFGFGEQKTPAPFVAACDKFVFTEILRPLVVASDPKAQKIQESKAIESRLSTNLPPLEELLRGAVDAKAGEDGWAPLASVGSFILTNHSSFDARYYGCKKLGELVRRQPYLEVKEAPVGAGQVLHIFIRAL